MDWTSGRGEEEDNVGAVDFLIPWGVSETCESTR